MATFPQTTLDTINAAHVTNTMLLYMLLSYFVQRPAAGHSLYDINCGRLSSEKQLVYLTELSWY